MVGLGKEVSFFFCYRILLFYYLDKGNGEILVLRNDCSFGFYDNF